MFFVLLSVWIQIFFDIFSMFNSAYESSTFIQIALGENDNSLNFSHVCRYCWHVDANSNGTDKVGTPLYISHKKSSFFLPKTRPPSTNNGRIRIYNIFPICLHNFHRRRNRQWQGRDVDDHNLSALCHHIMGFSMGLTRPGSGVIPHRRTRHENDNDSLRKAWKFRVFSGSHANSFGRKFRARNRNSKLNIAMRKIKKKCNLSYQHANTTLALIFK